MKDKRRSETSKRIITIAVAVLILIIIFFGYLRLTGFPTLKTQDTTICAPNTYYIDYVGGNDANNGTCTTSAWKHMPGMNGATGNPAAYSVQRGDTFILKGGVTWLFNSTVNDLIFIPASGITIRGGQQLATPWGSGYPVLDGNGSNGTRAAIYSQDKYGVTVDGLKLENTVLYSDGSGFGLEIFGNASGWEVKNNIIDNCGVDALGFSSDNGRFFSFHDNTVQNGGRVAIQLDSNVTFDNVQIYNNTMAGQGNWPAHGYHGDGFMIGADCLTEPSTFTNISIHDNKFYGNWTATALVYLNDGAGPSGNTRSGGYHALIYNNQFGIDTNDSIISPALVFVANNWKDVQIYSNTFNVNTVAAHLISFAVFLADMKADANISIKNNIFSGTWHGIGAGDLNASVGLTVDYNLYNTTGGNHFIWDKNNRWDTLADLQARGYESHGMVTDPRFISIPNGTIGSGNWHLQSTSPAIGNGTNLNSLFTNDLSGLTRGTIWDIGAYEYTNGTLTPINGQCGASNNVCLTGTLNDIADSSTSYLWQCLGSNSGTSASCSLAIPSNTGNTGSNDGGGSGSSGTIKTVTNATNASVVTNASSNTGTNQTAQTANQQTEAAGSNTNLSKAVQFISSIKNYLIIFAIVLILAIAIVWIIFQRRSRIDKIRNEMFEQTTANANDSTNQELTK